MPRIHPAYPVDDAELSELAPAARLDRQQAAIIAHRPELGDAVTQVMIAITSGEAGTLTPRLMELLRIRVAFWNQCRSCMSLRYLPDAISEDLVCSLERPEEADDLTDAEKAALGFADLMATNHLAIDESTFDGLREHYSEGEIVELSVACGAFVGFGRMAATWAMHDHLHARFRQEQDDAYTPWGEGALR